MIIDSHSHVSAPPQLYVWRSDLLAGREAWRPISKFSDEQLKAALENHLKLMDEVGTDIQFISPRPFQQMHSEKPEILVHKWIETNNEIIHQQVRVLPELGRCIRDFGFVGCLLNPDPSEGMHTTPPLTDEYWFPLYEKLVEHDVPALIHSAGCKNPRYSVNIQFIIEDSIAATQLLDPMSRILEDFPTLKFIIPHGGGLVPYQIGRWQSQAINRKERCPSRSRCASSTTTPACTPSAPSRCSSRRWGPTGCCSALRSRAPAAPAIPKPAAGWTTSNPSSRGWTS